MSTCHSMDETFCQRCETMGCEKVLDQNTIRELEAELSEAKKVIEERGYAFQEAIQKALAERGRLREALADVLHHGMRYENGKIHEADIEKAKQALALGEKAT